LPVSGWARIMWLIQAAGPAGSRVLSVEPD